MGQSGLPLVLRCPNCGQEAKGPDEKNEGITCGACNFPFRWGLLNRGPKPYYWSWAYYRFLVKTRSSRLEGPRLYRDAIERRRKAVLLASWLYRWLSRGAMALFAGSVLTVGICFFSLRGIQTVAVAVGLLILLSIIASIQGKVEKDLLEREKEKIGAERLSTFEEDAKRAEVEISAEWDGYCVRYEGYPPDWNERRKAVRERDGGCCTKCGWPKGYQRRARDLHVHHVQRLSTGGNNSMSNLVTLCHVCHREEEGGGHKQIKKMKNTSKNRRRRRRW